MHLKALIGRHARHTMERGNGVECACARALIQFQVEAVEFSKAREDGRRGRGVATVLLDVLLARAKVLPLNSKASPASTKQVQQPRELS